MTEQELILTVIDMMTEYNLSQYRKSNDEGYKTLNEEILGLSSELQKIMNDLPRDKATIIDNYITKTAMVAEKDCRYLYIQGAKDCVRSLKQLGVL